MTKFLVMLLALTAAWLAVLLAGYAAVRLLQLLFRLITAVLACVVVASAWVFTSALRPMRAAKRWAIRRLEPGVRFADPPSSPSVRVPIRPAPAAADEVLVFGDCGHLNRAAARFCGQCGASLSANRPVLPAAEPAGGEIVFLEPSTRQALRRAVRADRGDAV
jgi:hypothetical protein